MLKQYAIVFALVASLSACSSMTVKPVPTSNNTTPSVATGKDLSDTPGVDTNSNVGGAIGASMDKSDLAKMSRALDKPLGKETTWNNLSSGVSYTVTPLAKVSVNGNNLCRKYSTTATRGGNTQQFSGVACITTDGNWHPVG